MTYSLWRTPRTLWAVARIDRAALRALARQGTGPKGPTLRVRSRPPTHPLGNTRCAAASRWQKRFQRSAPWGHAGAYVCAPLAAVCSVGFAPHLPCSVFQPSPPTRGHHHSSRTPSAAPLLSYRRGSNADLRGCQRAPRTAQDGTGRPSYHFFLPVARWGRNRPAWASLRRYRPS